MSTVLSNEWRSVVIIFDAAIDTNRSFTAQVTSHPVETGVNINDHVTIENPKFSLKGVISDAAFLSPFDQIGSVVNTVTSFLGITERDSRALTSLQDLQFLLNSREFVTLQFGNEPPYENLILTSVNVPKDKNIGDAYVFDLEFEQVRVVSSRYTTVTASRVATPAEESLTERATASGNAETAAGWEVAETPLTGSVDKAVQTETKALADTVKSKYSDDPAATVAGWFGK